MYFIELAFWISSFVPLVLLSRNTLLWPALKDGAIAEDYCSDVNEYVHLSVPVQFRLNFFVGLSTVKFIYSGCTNILKFELDPSKNISEIS
jgi:hypothetical protein